MSKLSGSKRLIPGVLRLGVVCVASLSLAAASLAVHAPIARAQDQQDAGVTVVTGTVKVTNPFVLSDSAEPEVVLWDLTAFIKKDREMAMPSVQTVGFLQGKLAEGATFKIPLPIEPEGQFNDVSQGQGDNKGVKIYSADFDTNIVGDATLSPSEATGWPNGLDSLSFDPGTDEITGGKLLVWASDDNQMFPTSFGPDGKLFTSDDEVGPISKGWTVINLDKKPFEQLRDQTVDMPLLEGSAANNDLSTLTYTQAFDALVKDLRIRYPFTDFKKIDWDSLVKTLRPEVEKAEQNHDKEAFNIAMLKFVASFHDGHVYVDLPQQYFAQQARGGIGLTIGQTDDGTVIATQAFANLPAAKAGIKTGAQILEWNGQPIEKALSSYRLLFETQSSPHGIRLSQLRFLVRSPENTKVSIKYQNPGDSSAKTADIVSVRENKSFVDNAAGVSTLPEEMPVTVRVLPSGLGYIKINTFESDSILMTRSWEWALNKLNELNVPSLIIDMRANGGGSGTLARYFAGSFYSEEFELAESLLATKDGKFLSAGKDIVRPAPVQWTKPVAVLISPSCASACEIFVGSMAHDPSHKIVGRYPTAGIEAGVAPWTLPDGLYFQSPIVKIVSPDGSIFLEGQGVKPNVKVPVTVKSLLAPDVDQEIPAAEKALSGN